MPAGMQYLVSVRAAWIRVVMGLIMLTALPLVLPATAQHRWLFASYTVLAVGTQFLVRRDIGGELRTATTGMLDMCMITFLVHRLGSLSSMIVLLYVFVAILYAIAVRRSIAIWLATFASATYVALLTLEFSDALPYAPDAPEWAIQPATGQTLAAAGVMVSLLTIAATVTVANLVQLLRNREDLLEDLSRRDPLTQLSNRRHLLERIDIELARVRRGHELAMLMIDLDGFKQINDSIGHAGGDLLLQRVAERLQSAVRVCDTVARLGGDEFVVALENLGHPADAEAVADCIRARIEHPFRIRGQAVQISASIGIALLGVHADDVDGLLRHADSRMYEAKRARAAARVPEPAASLRSSSAAARNDPPPA